MRIKSMNAKSMNSMILYDLSATPTYQAQSRLETRTCWMLHRRTWEWWRSNIPERNSWLCWKLLNP